MIRAPLRLQRVRALITEPAAGQTLPAGLAAIRGVAWSGMAPIARVDLSIGGGPWRPARLFGEGSEHGWQRWELTRVLRSGPTTIRARATDQAGRTQPERSEWNRLGYGANGVHQVPIRVE